MSAFPTPSTAPFSPSEALAAQILDSAASPDLSLRDIAVEAGTTLESLVLWLAVPEIAERLSNLESAIARGTRLVATNALPFVARTLSLIVEEHNREESTVPLKTDSLVHLEQHRRARGTARRAGSLLLRLAKFEPGPARSSSSSQSWLPRRSAAGSSTPSQREGAGSGLVVASLSARLNPTVDDSVDATRPEQPNSTAGYTPPLRGEAGGRERATIEPDLAASDSDALIHAGFARSGAPTSASLAMADVGSDAPAEASQASEPDATPASPEPLASTFQPDEPDFASATRLDSREVSARLLLASHPP